MFNDDTPRLQARILSIKSTLIATASWRASVAQKHQDDPRNQQAAELLTALAKEDFSTLPAELLAAIAACPNLRLKLQTHHRDGSLRKSAEDFAFRHAGLRALQVMLLDPLVSELTF